METSVNRGKRLGVAIDYAMRMYGFRTQAEFVEAIKGNQTCMSQAKNGHPSYVITYINYVCNRFKELNKEWLLNGAGSMFIGKSHWLYQLLSEKGIYQLDLAKECDIDIIQLYKVLDHREPIDREMARRISLKYPEYSIDWLMSGDSNTNQESAAESTPSNVVPLIPISAIGGSLSLVDNNGVTPDDCEMIVSPLPNAKFAIEVSGESMSPEYPNGCRVFVKQVDHQAFIEWGAVYVLDTINGAIIKEVNKCNKQGYITCTSRNTDPKYAPYEVAISSIRGWYKVMACLILK